MSDESSHRIAARAPTIVTLPALRSAIVWLGGDRARPAARRRRALLTEDGVPLLTEDGKVLLAVVKP